MPSSFPFASYKEAWVDFREITNETSATAKHLIKKTSITKNHSIIDIGCGDGTLLKSVLNNNFHSIKRAVLVEIEEALLEKAKINLQSLPFSPVCKYINKDLTLLNINEYQNSDAILASHVFYLVKDDFLKNFIADIPAGVKIYIILDEPYSVFDSFWVHTASFFHERLKLLHNTFSNLPTNFYTTKKTIIKSKMKNPLLLAHDKKINILSLLCYSDINHLFSSDPTFFCSTLKKFQEGNFLTYNSYCYEVQRIR